MFAAILGIALLGSALARSAEAQTRKDEDRSGAITYRGSIDGGLTVRAVDAGSVGGGGGGLELTTSFWPIFNRSYGIGITAEGSGTFFTDVQITTFQYEGRFSLTFHFGADPVVFFGEFGLGGRYGGVSRADLFTNSPEFTPGGDVYAHSYWHTLAGFHLYLPRDQRLDIYGIIDFPILADGPDFAWGAGASFTIGDASLRIDYMVDYKVARIDRLATVLRVSIAGTFYSWRNPW